MISVHCSTPSPPYSLERFFLFRSFKMLQNVQTCWLSAQWGGAAPVCPVELLGAGHLSDREEQEQGRLYPPQVRTGGGTRNINRDHFNFLLMIRKQRLNCNDTFLCRGRSRSEHGYTCRKQARPAERSPAAEIGEDCSDCSDCNSHCSLS